MSYFWVNNGVNNQKVYNDVIPDGFVLGYICHPKNKIKILKKLDEQYNKKLQYLEQQFEKKKERLLEWLNKEQHKYVNF